jgi:MBG domain (YGX type)/Ricin-type beta-trefoil lectin domain-like/MBG domain
MKSPNYFVILAARSLKGTVLFALFIMAAFVSPISLFSQTTPAILFEGDEVALADNIKPWDIAVDLQGDIFMANATQNTIVELPANGGPQINIGSGLICQINFGSGPTLGCGVAVDRAGNVYIADIGNGRVVEVPANGGPQINIGSGLSLPDSVAVDAAGDVFIADLINENVVEVMAGSGNQRTLVSGIAYLYGVAVDGFGDVFIAQGNQVIELPAGGGPQINIGSVGTPGAVAVDRAGDVFITDEYNGVVVEVPAGGGPQITVLNLGLYQSHGLAVDQYGDLFVAVPDYGLYGEVLTAVRFPTTNICPAGQTSPAPCSQTEVLNYNITTAVTISQVKAFTQGINNLDFTVTANTCTGTLSGGSTCAVTVKFTPKAPGTRIGAVQMTYSTGETAATASSTPIYGEGIAPTLAFGPGAQTTLSSGSIYGPAIAVDAAGDVFIVYPGTAGEVLEEIPAGGGAPMTLASLLFPPGSLNGVAVDGDGNIFVAAYYSGIVKVPAGGGTPTTVVSTTNGVRGLAVDAVGDVFFGMCTGFAKGDIMEVPAHGGSPLAIASLNTACPTSVAVDATGDIFFTLGESVEEIPAGGGNPISVASDFTAPEQLAVDAAGDIFVVDSGSYRVVEIPAGGGAQTTVGSGLIEPYGVAVDGAGNVFIADTGNERVLKVNRSSVPALTFTTGLDMTSSPMPLTLQNVGNQPLQAVAPGIKIGNAAFEQTAGSGTPADCTSTFSLTPGESCDLNIVFMPTAVSTVKSSLVLTDNSLHANPAKQTVNLTGNGVLLEPVVQVSAGPFNYNGLAQSAACTVTDQGGASVPGSCTLTYNGSSTVPINTGTYTVVASFTSKDPSYENASVTGTMTINKVPLTVTANGAVFLQGGTFPTFTVSYSGFVDSQNNSVLTGTLKITTTATSASALGDYPITPSGLTSANYTIMYVNGTLAVLPSTGLSGITYNIRNVNSGLYLGVLGASMSNGADIVQWTPDGSLDQDWTLIMLKNGAYQIMDVNSGLFMGVLGASTSEGAALVQWQADTSTDQQWRFTPVGSNWLITDVNSGLQMAIQGNSATAGTQVIQWPADGSTSQVFTLTPLQ